MDSDLSSSYQRCKQICRESGSSFCWTFSLLPSDQCRAMQSLYAFARIVDDIADSAGDDVSRRSPLLLIKDCILNGKAVTDAVTAYHGDVVRIWPALTQTVRDFELPRRWLGELVDGMLMDIDHLPLADWQQLDDYCYKVASTVGLACTRIWRCQPGMPERPAIQCGIAFQMTNILRDIAKDRKLGRNYIPVSEFDRFGVPIDRWMAGHADGNWRPMLEHFAEVAAQHYQSSWQVIEYLDPSGQRMFSLMWRYYRQLLQQLQRDLSFVKRGDLVRVPITSKARLAIQHFFSPLYRTLNDPMAVRDLDRQVSGE